MKTLSESLMTIAEWANQGDASRGPFPWAAWREANVRANSARASLVWIAQEIEWGHDMAASLEVAKRAANNIGEKPQ